MHKIVYLIIFTSFAANAQNAFDKRSVKNTTNQTSTFINNLPKINGKNNVQKNIAPAYVSPVTASVEVNFRSTETKRAAIANRAEANVKAYVYLKTNGNKIAQNFNVDNYSTISSEQDAQGIYHTKLQQNINGIEVYGGEVFVHFLTNETYTHGYFIDIPANFNTTPAITKTQAIKKNNTSITPEFGTVTLNEKQLKLLNYTGAESVLKVFVYNNIPTLCYEITSRPNFIEQWISRINAQTGEVIESFNKTCHVDGPKTGSGTDLNGNSRNINSYQIGSTYYMIDASKTDMFSSSQSSLPDNPVGAIWTLDAGNTPASDFNHVTSNSANFSNTKAVSAHNNANTAYEYFKNTFGRNSINGKGGTIISVINVSDENGGSMDNAYWNGQLMAYGNGKTGFKPLAGGLDVGGHEMTHGVVQNTANLEYKGQSGAINESMSDIFGCMMDRADWLMGEDVVKLSAFPSGALRNLQDPHNGGNKLGDAGFQTKKMSEYFAGPENNYGVHINSGIPNHAYYLLATNITKEKAEQIFYKALTTYLTKTSKFTDLRAATIQAAKDLYTITEAQAVAAAFDAVEIYGAPVTGGGSAPIGNNVADLPTNPGSGFVLYYDLDNSVSYTLTKGDLTTSTSVGQITRNVKRKPSVVDNGSYAIYVGSDSKIYKLLLNGSKTETILSDEAIWSNVAISKDGKRLAAVTNNIDTAIYVYDFTKSEWKVYTLYNPTFSGVNSGGVLYADALEWDHSGTKIMYDAKNFVNNQSGTDYTYWDVGIVNVWDLEQNNWGDGSAEKLFSSLPNDISIGNAVFSQNSPYIVAFDYIDASNNSYAVQGYNLNTNKIASIFTGSDLGFPCYNRTDNAVCFNAFDGNNDPVLGVKNLTADKITATGTATILVNEAKWGVFYANGSRSLLFTQKDMLTFGFEGLNPQVNATISGNNITCTVPSNINKASLTPNFTSSPYSYVRISSARQTSGVNTNNFANTLVYTVVAQDGSTKNYNVTVNGGTVSVDKNTINKLLIYPNPTQHSIQIENLQNAQFNQIKIHNSMGVLVKTIALNNQSNLTLDFSEFAKGIYILNFEGKENASYKLMKN